MSRFPVPKFFLSWLGAVAASSLLLACVSDGHSADYSDASVRLFYNFSEFSKERQIIIVEVNGIAALIFHTEDPCNTGFTVLDRYIINGLNTMRVLKLDLTALETSTDIASNTGAVCADSLTGSTAGQSNGKIFHANVVNASASVCGLSIRAVKPTLPNDVPIDVPCSFDMATATASFDVGEYFANSDKGLRLVEKVDKVADLSSQAASIEKVTGVITSVKSALTNGDINQYLELINLSLADTIISVDRGVSTIDDDKFVKRLAESKTYYSEALCGQQLLLAERFCVISGMIKSHVIVPLSWMTDKQAMPLSSLYNTNGIKIYYHTIVFMENRGVIFR